MATTTSQSSRALKQGPSVKWTTREQLILASAVQRSGDQNWVSVSRAVKPLAESSRSPDYFSQKNCALQYSAMLDKATAPKRKRSGDGSLEAAETVGELIVRNLTEKRIAELDVSLNDLKEEYLTLKKEIEQLEHGELDDKLDEMLQEIEKEMAEKEGDKPERKGVEKKSKAKSQALTQMTAASTGTASGGSGGAPKLLVATKPAMSVSRDRQPSSSVEQQWAIVAGVTGGSESSSAPAENRKSSNELVNSSALGSSEVGQAASGRPPSLSIAGPVSSSSSSTQPKDVRGGGSTTSTPHIQASSPSLTTARPQLASDVHVVLQVPNLAVAGVSVAQTTGHAPSPIKKQQHQQVDAVPPPPPPPAAVVGAAPPSTPPLPSPSSSSPPVIGASTTHALKTPTVLASIKVSVPPSSSMAVVGGGAGGVGGAAATTTGEKTTPTAPTSLLPSSSSLPQPPPLTPVAPAPPRPPPSNANLTQVQKKKPPPSHSSSSSSSLNSSPLVPAPQSTAKSSTTPLPVLPTTSAGGSRSTPIAAAQGSVPSVPAMVTATAGQGGVASSSSLPRPLVVGAGAATTSSTTTTTTPRPSSPPPGPTTQEVAMDTTTTTAAAAAVAVGLTPGSTAVGGGAKKDLEEPAPVVEGVSGALEPKETREGGGGGGGGGGSGHGGVESGITREQSLQEEERRKEVASVDKDREETPSKNLQQARAGAPKPPPHPPIVTSPTSLKPLPQQPPVAATPTIPTPTPVLPPCSTEEEPEPSLSPPSSSVSTTPVTRERERVEGGGGGGGEGSRRGSNVTEATPLSPMAPPSRMQSSHEGTEEEEEEEEECPVKTRKSPAFRRHWLIRSRKRRYEKDESVLSTEDSEDDLSSAQPSTAPSPCPSQSELDSEMVQAHRAWKKSIMLVWRTIAQHKYANLFLHRVKDDDAPGYYEIIHRPMDLTTIKKNTECGAIRNDIDFQRDVLLMFQNAFMYNKSNYHVYVMAEEMRTDVMESIQDYLATKYVVQTSGTKALRSREGRVGELQEEDRKLKRPLMEDSPAVSPSPSKRRRNKADE